ncbi:GPR1/FUN34/yaaH family-domain-containing protein, partial [Coemansia spiralis]
IAPPPQFRRFGNAAALGLITFGICTVQQSMMQAGMSVGYGHGYGTMTAQSIAVAGIAQLFSGLWQIANGDTFEGAAFTSFGASWLAKGLAAVPGIGVTAYQQNESPDLVRKQNGIVSLAWSIWVFILLAGNVKSHVANIILFFTLNLQLDFSCAGEWLGHERLDKAGGWFGFFCGLSAMYNAAAILLNEENFWFNLPV